MRIKQLSSHLFIVSMILLSFQCQNSQKDSSKSTSLKRSYLLGSVPMPQNADFSDNGMNNAFDLVNEIGEVVSLSEKISWKDDSNTYDNDVDRANSRSLKLFISADVLTDDRTSIDFSGGIPGTWTGTENFSDPELRTAFIDEVKKIATDYAPEYLMLGIEINIYKTVKSGDFPNYVTLYESAYDQIKAISPNTKVGVTMQYEHIFAYNQWNLFDDFKNKIDVLCFTSYPGALSAVTDTYYSAIIRDHFQATVPEISDKEIVFTEIGISGQSASDEEDQAKFIDKFFTITKDLDNELVIWCLLHDWPGGGFFEFMGLIDSSGRKRSAWNKWKEHSNIPFSR